MDVVSFNWNALDVKTQMLIRDLAVEKFGYVNERSAPVGRWLRDFCSDTEMSMVYGYRADDGEKYIRDFIVTMPREKYVEFVLTWL